MIRNGLLNKVNRHRFISMLPAFHAFDTISKLAFPPSVQIFSALTLGSSYLTNKSYEDWQKYNSSNPEIANQSESIDAFTSHLKNASEGRFVSSSEGPIWQTEDKDLSDLVRANFPGIIENTGLLEYCESKDPIKTQTLITTDESISKSPDFEDMPSISNVSAGGLPALWSAYIQSVLYKEGVLGNDNTPPIYVMPPNMQNSAAFGSSTQFHVSHATPMYTDPEFGTVNIMLATLQRNLFPSYDNPERDNYMIGEIKPSALLDPEVISVGVSYLFHELKYKANSALGLQTIADQTIPMAILSGQIMDKVGEELGIPVLLRKDTIRVAYNEAETKELEDIHKQLVEYGIESNRVNIDQAQELTGTRPVIGEGGSVWSFKGDGNMNPDLVPLLTEAIKNNGGRVVEGFVDSVYCDKDKGKVAALKVKNGDKEEIIKTNNIFTSFGARAKYNISNEITNYKKPESIISGTGYSAYLIVEADIKRPIDSNNTHFTPLAHGKNKDGKIITLVKSTCGGAIGTDSFCIDHAVNSLHYATNIIFPDAKVDIISAKSCSRPLNGQNSVKLTEIVPGLHTATGWGGKGVTDAAGFVLTHVAKLLQPNIVNVFLESFGTEKDKKPSHKIGYSANLKTPRVESYLPAEDEIRIINSDKNLQGLDANEGFVARLKNDKPPPEQNKESKIESRENGFEDFVAGQSRLCGKH